jgi:hypothetical protein
VFHTNVRNDPRNALQIYLLFVSKIVHVTGRYHKIVHVTGRYHKIVHVTGRYHVCGMILTCICRWKSFTSCSMK